MFDFILNVLINLLANFWSVSVRTAKMFTALKKIHKEKGAEPSEFEESVAQVSDAFQHYLFFVMSSTVCIVSRITKRQEHVHSRHCLIWKTQTMS